jgi:hypothetical protein
MGDEGSRERRLLQDVRDQNSHLQQLIEITASLLARSHELLRRLRLKVGSTADTKRPAE